MSSESLRAKSPPTVDVAYRSEVLVRFAHCDPAGIVFYPRYLEMFNNLVEDWCASELGLPFKDLMPNGIGLPTAHLEADFLAPSHLGEVLLERLLVRAVGRSSIRLEILLEGPDGRVRVRGKVVLVMTDAECGGSVPLSDDFRERVAKFLVAE